MPTQLPVITSSPAPEELSCFRYEYWEQRPLPLPTHRPLISRRPSSTHKPPLPAYTEIRLQETNTLLLPLFLQLLQPKQQPSQCSCRNLYFLPLFRIHEIGKYATCLWWSRTVINLYKYEIGVRKKDKEVKTHTQWKPRIISWQTEEGAVGSSASSDCKVPGFSCIFVHALGW